MTTEGPWQRSRYIDNGVRMSKEYVAKREAEEARIIRGPGVVGTSACNIVAHVECPNPADFALMVAAADLYEALKPLARVKLTGTLHGNDQYFPVERRIIEAAQAAIRKAQHAYPRRPR